MGGRSSPSLTSHGLLSEKRWDTVLADDALQQSKPDRSRCENRDQADDRNTPPHDDNLFTAFSSAYHGGKSGLRFGDGQLHGSLPRPDRAFVTGRSIRTQNRRGSLLNGRDGHGASRRTGGARSGKFGKKTRMTAGRNEHQAKAGPHLPCFLEGFSGAPSAAAPESRLRKKKHI